MDSYLDHECERICIPHLRIVILVSTNTFIFTPINTNIYLAIFFTLHTFSNLVKVCPIFY